MRSAVSRLGRFGLFWSGSEKYRLEAAFLENVRERVNAFFKKIGSNYRVP